MRQQISHQFRVLRPLFLWLHGPALLLLGLMSSYCIATDTPFYILSRDIADTADVHPLTGMLSNMGMWFWSGAMMMCLFGCLAFKSVPASRRRWFFGVFGVLSLMLLADDLFMLHETLIPRHLLMSDNRVTLFYVIVFPLSFWYFREIVRKTNFLLVIVAALCFAFSIVIDKTHDYFLPDLIHHMLEDGAKFIGIVSWFAYFLTTCLQSVQPRSHLDAP